MTKKIGRHSLPHEPAFHRLDSPVTEAFDCGEKPQNAFLLEHAWQDQQHQLSVTYIAHVGAMLAGYVTLANSELQLSVKERPAEIRFARVAALKLLQMGVHKPFAGQGLGSLLVDFAIVRACAVQESAGCRYVILDATPDRVSFYQGLGFERNDAMNREKRRQVKRRTVATLIWKR